MTTQSELKELANQDPTVSPYRVTVLYGDYGKRKTTTACSMTNERGLLLSSDDSWKVLLNDRHAEIFKKHKIIKLEAISQLDYIDLDGYDTIIWDTLSHSVDVFLDLLYDKGTWTNKAGGPGYREQIQTKEKELSGLEVLAPIDYRVTRDKLRPAFNRLFKETKANIIFTSQVTEPLPGLSKDTKAKPSIPAATFKIVGTRADLIACIKPTNRGKFVVDLTEDSMTILGKSRIQGLQGQMDLEVFVNKYKEIVF